MLMGNNRVKSYVAQGAVQPRRFVKFGASDTQVVQAVTADTNIVIGISDLIGATDTARCEVFVGDHADVEFGGNVARGQAVKADASGRAILAAAGEAFCGISMVTAVAGDIASVRIDRGTAT